MGNTILGANTLSSGYEVANSCRFNRADGPNMTKTPGSSGDLRKWTWSCWVKRGSISNGSQTMFNAGSSSNTQLRFDSDDSINFYQYHSGAYTARLATNRKFKDVTAWYHIVAHWDTDNGTGGDRMKLYVNGVEETSFATDTNPNQNLDSYFGASGTALYVGDKGDGAEEMDGYLAEMVFINGQNLAPTSFGEFDEDSPSIWKPIDVSGLTFGTNGFYLDFEDSSNLGNDKSGGTDFTENNIAAADQSTDTPTNNFATLNPLDQAETGTAIVFSQGNCKGVTAVDTTAALQSTIAVSSGKWYAEFKVTKVGDNLSGGRTTVGIGSRTNAQVNGYYYGNTASPVDSYGKYSASAHYYSNNGSTTSYGSSFVDDDIIGVYLDLDNNKLYFSENGTLYSSTGISITAAASTLNGHYHIGFSDASANDNGEVEANYGGCPAFTISSAVSDDNGYGSFEYSPNITGDGEAKKFYALCTKNLAEFG